MRFVFIGRFEKVSFVDLIAFDDEKTALDYYENVFYNNEQGYKQIELLEQTATHYYNQIKKTTMYN